MKMLHPHGVCSDEDFEEYIEYAIEGRRRVKEQMNKRKPDDEFAKIDLSYFNAQGAEVIVRCPESVEASATLYPQKSGMLVERSDNEGQGEIHQPETKVQGKADEPVIQNIPAVQVAEEVSIPKLREQHFTINYDSTWFSYESIILPYLVGAKSVVVEDPYIRATHQVQNFVRFCEAVLKQASVRNIELIISYYNETNVQEMAERLLDIKQSLLEFDVNLDVKVNENLHDREIRIDNGWVVKIGGGLDFFQKPESWFGVGANDLSLRKCLETKVDIFRSQDN